MYAPFRSEEEKKRADGGGVLTGCSLAFICWVISELFPVSFVAVGGIFAVPAIALVVIFVAFTRPKKMTPMRYMLLLIPGVYLGAYLLVLIVMSLLERQVII